MARRGQDFNEFLESYRESASPEELAIYEAKQEQFALANAIMERRKAMHLTQAELSERTGLLQPEISRIESGDSNSTITTLQRVAMGLNAHIGLIVEDDEMIHAH
jgi:HTH-type transcriptional regulator/antitoxin HipB